MWYLLPEIEKKKPRKLTNKLSAVPCLLCNGEYHAPAKKRYENGLSLGTNLESHAPPAHPLVFRYENETN